MSAARGKRPAPVLDQSTKVGVDSATLRGLKDRIAEPSCDGAEFTRRSSTKMK